MNGVPYISPAILASIMEPRLCPAASLRSSATAFEALGQTFSADLCRTMATDCASMGSMGDALYRHWAREQAERVAQCLTMAADQDTQPPSGSLPLGTSGRADRAVSPSGQQIARPIFGADQDNQEIGS